MLNNLGMAVVDMDPAGTLTENPDGYVFAGDMLGCTKPDTDPAEGKSFKVSNPVFIPKGASCDKGRIIWRFAVSNAENRLILVDRPAMTRRTYSPDQLPASVTSWPSIWSSGSCTAPPPRASW